MNDDRRRDDELGADRAELQADFAALRDEVRASGRVPSFEAMLARAKQAAADGPPEARPRRRFGPFNPWIPLAAAAGLATLLFVGLPREDADAEFERLVSDYAASTTGWRSPTASLLDIPGVDLGAVPRVGGGLPALDAPVNDAPEGRDS